MELLALSFALVFNDAYKTFDTNKIYTLVEEYYLMDLMRRKRLT